MALRRLAKWLFGRGVRMSREDAMKVFERDHFKCQYCGLDGLSSFENWLIMTIDHVHPSARGGPRTLDNLLTACQPCNLLKGDRVFASQEAARQYVLARRKEWRHVYHRETAALKSPGHGH